MGARRHPYSPATGLPIESQTVSQMVDRVLALPDGTRIYVLAPVVRGRKGEYKKELADFMRKGYQRVKIDGEFYEIADVKPLDKKFTHDIDVVVDRLVVQKPISARRWPIRFEHCAEARRGPGHRRDRRNSRPRAPPPIAADNANAERIMFSEKFACRSPASPFRKSSRGCSRSTTRSAPARPAAASASSSISMPT